MTTVKAYLAILTVGVLITLSVIIGANRALSQAPEDCGTMGIDVDRNGRVNSGDQLGAALRIAEKFGHYCLIPTFTPTNTSTATPSPTPSPTPSDPFASPTPEPVTGLTRFVLVYPADWPTFAYADDAAIDAAFVEGVEAVRQFYLRETGKSFVPDVRIWHSALTARELGSSPGTDDAISLDGCAANIPQGQGLNGTTVLESVMTYEMGLPFKEQTVPPFTYGTLENRVGGPYHKHIALVLNGGGYAGGNWDNPTKSGHNVAGQAKIGDWQLRYAVTGAFDPCAYFFYGSGGNCGLCTSDWRGTFLHEISNAFGVDPYAAAGGYVGALSDHLSEQQIANFLTRNDGFIE